MIIRSTLGRSFVRTLFKLSPWEIAHIGIIFPTPMYFDQDPGIRIFSIVGILLFFAFMVSVVLNTEGQSIYDRILGTKVSQK